jgi:HEPN domain-containing protein
MTPCTEEAQRLLSMASRDFDAFSILAAHPDAPLTAMCFHAQQCVEKSLKSVLTVHCIDFSYTHNLEELGWEIEKLGVKPPFSPRELRRLNTFAVAARYDDTKIILLPVATLECFAKTSIDWARPLVEAGL